MGKEKSELHNKDKSLGKNSAQYLFKARSAKRTKKSKKGLEEIDSLIFLKDSKDIKEGYRLDERIKILGSELKMLLGESKSEDSQNLPDNKCYQKKSLVLESDKEAVGKSNSKAEPSQNLLPTKFSEWLDKTIDEITENSKNQKKPQCNDLVLNSNSQAISIPHRFSAGESSSKLKCVNPSSLPQQKVEQLLYKSFYMQNFDIYLSSSEENEPDHIKPTNAIKQKKRKKRNTRKSSILNKKNPFGSCKCLRTRKRKSVAKILSKSKVDLLNGSSSDNNVVMKEKNIELVDLDLTNYDWSEPFVLDENAGVFPDVEVIENPGEERSDFNEQTKGNNSKPIEHDLNISTEKLDSDRSKKAWECPICFEISKGQEVVATQCGHIFCKRCLEGYMVQFNQNCPTCRTDLSNKPCITLFNF